MRFLLAATVACAAVALSTAPAHSSEAYSLNIAGVSYDEECLTYCLQGLVNRDAPRLFLDTTSIFGPSDKYWLKYLAERKGFHFTSLATLRDAIEQFRGSVQGLVVYDPSEDATRYLALTMAAQRNLLPVTPNMLKYDTPALRGARHWTDDGMSDPSLWHAAGATAEKSVDGMKVVQDTPLIGFGAVERVVELDLARTPILEITVAACTAHWALKVNDGALVDLELESDANRTGVLRYDLRPILKHGSGPVKVRIFAVGDKSSVTVQRLRLLSADGQSVPPLIDRDVDCFRGMKVVEDLRGRFPSDVAAYRWALDDLMPLCTKRLAFCAGHNHGDSVLGGDPSITLGLDYPIAQKAFVFNLSPGGVPFGYNGKDYPGYPEQAKLFDEIMSHLDRPAGIYGWSEPEVLYCASAAAATSSSARRPRTRASGRRSPRGRTCTCRRPRRARGRSKPSTTSPSRRTRATRRRSSPA